MFITEKETQSPEKNMRNMLWGEMVSDFTKIIKPGNKYRFYKETGDSAHSNNYI